MQYVYWERIQHRGGLFHRDVVNQGYLSHLEVVKSKRSQNTRKKLFLVVYIYIH